MDPFDDLLPAAPAGRGRPGGKFAPKAKSKKPPPKEKSGSEHDACVSDLSMPAKQSMGSANSSQAELPNLEEQISVKGDTAVLADAVPSTPALSEVEPVLNFTDLPKPAREADPVTSELGPDTNPIPETSLTVSMEEPPESVKGSLLESNKRVELIDTSSQVGLDMGLESSLDNSVTIFESNIQSSFVLDPFSDVLPDSGTKTASKFQPKIKPRPRVGTAKALASASSNVMMGKSVELPTPCTNEVNSFNSSGDGNGGLHQSSDSPVSTSDIITTINSSNKFENISSSIPLSEDSGSLAAVIPSQLGSLNAMLSEVSAHNGTRDLPPRIGKSVGENADFFSGLDSLDDLLPQAATDTGKPSLQSSFNEKSTEGDFVISASNSMNFSGICDTTQVQRTPEYHTAQDSLNVDEATVLNKDDTHANYIRSATEEVVELSTGCPANDILDYQFLKSSTDPTSEIPMHEELTIAADNPTLAELLQADVIGEKEDGTRLGSLRKHRRSSGSHEEDKGVETSRQQRKQAPQKPVNKSMLEDDIDPPYTPIGDELDENDDEFEVDNSSKKTASSLSKKHVSKNGKTSRKRKNDNEAVEDTAKKPRKKFSHSTRRRKRTVNKSLLEIPEDELDMQTLPLKDIILLAEYKERLAKKEASTSKTPSTNQRDRDPFHEDDAYGEEEENFGSEDGREPGDDQASKSVPLASSLFNYQSFMDKAPRGKWTKHDTELFYEAVREFGTDFSVIQQLFPDRTRHQIKLKYKKEERQHPLRLADAVNNRSKDHAHFKLVIERLQQASTKADQDPGREEAATDFMTGEDVEDLAPSTNEEDVAATEPEVVTATDRETNVKDQEDSMPIQSPEQSDDDSDDDLQKWAQYKSEY